MPAEGSRVGGNQPLRCDDTADDAFVRLSPQPATDDYRWEKPLDAVDKGALPDRCTCQTYGRQRYKQAWYTCVDCNRVLEANGERNPKIKVCLPCAKKCHPGHKLQYVRISAVLCNCRVIDCQMLKVGGTNARGAANGGAGSPSSTKHTTHSKRSGAFSLACNCRVVRENGGRDSSRHRSLSRVVGGTLTIVGGPHAR